MNGTFVVDPCDSGCKAPGTLANCDDPSDPPPDGDGDQIANEEATNNAFKNVVEEPAFVFVTPAVVGALLVAGALGIRYRSKKSKKGKLRAEAPHHNTRHVDSTYLPTPQDGGDTTSAAAGTPGCSDGSLSSLDSSLSSSALSTTGPTGDMDTVGVMENELPDTADDSEDLEAAGIDTARSSADDGGEADVEATAGIPGDFLQTSVAAPSTADACLSEGTLQTSHAALSTADACLSEGGSVSGDFALSRV